MPYEASDIYFPSPLDTLRNSFQRTLPYAANAGDVILAYVEWDDSSSVNSPAVSSSNIAWSSELDDGTLPSENQATRTFRGKVTTGFSANTEVVTVSGWTDDAFYVGIVTARFSPSSGKVFATEPVQQHSDFETAAPSTSTDGVSASVTTTGGNSFVIVGFVACDTHFNYVDSGNADIHAGTGYTLDAGLWRQLNEVYAQPFLIEHKAQASAGLVNVTFTADTPYSVYVAAFALEEIPAGSPPQVSMYYRTLLST